MAISLTEFLKVTQLHKIKQPAGVQGNVLYGVFFFFSKTMHGIILTPCYFAQVSEEAFLFILGEGFSFSSPISSFSCNFLLAFFFQEGGSKPPLRVSNHLFTGIT